jgi:hypothetical protein
MVVGCPFSLLPVGQSGDVVTSRGQTSLFDPIYSLLLAPATETFSLNLSRDEHIDALS